MYSIREIYAYRQMIFSLVHRELRGRYKGSVLGFLWTFLNPLLQLIVYSFVFSFLMRAGIEKYYLFLFVALVPWIFFATSLTGGSMAVIYQGNLVKKIYFPREVLPIAFVTTCFVNMLLSFIIIFIVLILSGIPLNPQALCFLPLVMVAEYILALGVTFIVSAITVYFRDFEHILGIIAMAWMYLSPVLYPLDMIPEQYKKIFMANPMAPIIKAYRDILYYSQIPEFITIIWTLLVGGISLVIGLCVFKLLERHFVEEL
jgi:ABC-2 type transport system permease protein